MGDYVQAITWAVLLPVFGHDNDTNGCMTSETVRTNVADEG